MTEFKAEIRVLIVADVRIYREGLAHVLDLENGIAVVGTASDAESAITKIQAVRPDIVLFDMAIPGSLATTRLIVNAGPARVVGLGVEEVEGDVIACAEAGVSGYIPGDASVSDLVRAITSVHRGELLCSPRMAATLYRHAGMSATFRARPHSTRALTSRELEIVQWLDCGLSNKEIARRIGIEVSTVKNHVHHILEKLNVRRRGEAAARMRGSLQRHMSTNS